MRSCRWIDATFFNFSVFLWQGNNRAGGVLECFSNYCEDSGPFLSRHKKDGFQCKVSGDHQILSFDFVFFKDKNKRILDLLHATRAKIIAF